MNDSLPLTRLDMLRFLERVQLGDLQRTRRWIADEERRQAERQRGEQVRPPAPDWLIEMSLNGRSPLYIHAGDCHMAGKRSKAITREQARDALNQQVPACSHCNPDTELGLLG
ncbi:DUF6233 domain-containing protein [Streptomyces sp. NPDC059009]|uniref:DUF6233 domain-containing protein n=1 Tax=Streptomyces sp. NPDC059009 TaxID=3346694 RepID=UPI0036ABF5B7